MTPLAELRPERLRPGDRVRLVSPASPVTPDAIDTGPLEALGLVVELGEHALAVDDRLDYLAGPDADRLADVNAALRDPGVKAIIATRGGKGAEGPARRGIAALRRPDGGPGVVLGLG